ncbi:MAG TPA: sigma-54 dependent transcriptional regulator [Thermoanaerobaculia bacterium]|nr:sigma-54 dependent transcriptional regulator [Thermoanaerobaculia bacterium]
MKSGKGTILLVEDEKPALDLLRKILEAEGFRVVAAGNGREALDRLDEEIIDVVITDLAMPVMSGTELVGRLQALPDPPPVIVVTAHGSREAGRELVNRMGVYDYLSKPFQPDDLILKIERAVEMRAMREANRVLSGQLKGTVALDSLVGGSPAMQNIFKLVLKIARSNATVLIRGESGTGKELIARAIHRRSRRADGAFAAINCAAIPETLLESELFGYERGAFTGADRRKIGLFESAAESTLFLDEIGDLSMPLQGKILRALQEKEIRRVGGNESIPVDVRVLAATNRDLEQMMRDGSFREDLYYRLNVIPIVIPPLRERRDDIPEIATRFAKRAAAEHGKPPVEISPDAMRALVAYDWPGNVRQLESSLERSILLCEGTSISADDLPEEVRRPRGPAASVRVEIPAEGIDIEQVERSLLIEAMEKSDWVIARAARLLNLTYRTMQYRLEKFGIRKSE